MSEDDSFTQYASLPVTLTISSDEIIDHYEITEVEIDADALLRCNDCSREQTLDVLQDTAIRFTEEEAEEAEEAEEVETVASPSLPPSPVSTAWEQVKPSKEASA